MQLLVLYDSIEGQTRKIAEHIASGIEVAGHEVFLTRAGDPGYCDPATYDGAVLCAPIHIGRYPSAFVKYVHDWAGALAATPNAFVSVTLAIASDDEGERREAMDFPRQLEDETGWAPGMIHHAAGALKYLEYDFFKRWMMKRIAAKEGGATDTSRDHEFTDWKALDEFVGEFLKAAAS